MAINPKTIKALFGKLAPYADDVAEGVVKYGDDATRLVADNAGRALPSLDIYSDDYLDALEGIATHKPIAYTAYSPKKVWKPEGLRNIEINKTLKDSASVPPPELDLYVAPPIRKTDFPGYRKVLEDTVDFPDGFATPDSFAKYYDSLELGYIPAGWTQPSGDELSTIFDALSSRELDGTVKGNRLVSGLDYDPAIYSDFIADGDEGPLNEFFRTRNKLPRGRGGRLPNSEEIFSNPMFWDDLWLK